MAPTLVEGPPEPGELVDVLLDRRTEASIARVVAVQGTALDVAPLRSRSKERVELVAEELGLLVWRGARALVQAPFAVEDPAGGARPWRAQLLGDAAPAQRRAFVRADVDLPARLLLGETSLAVRVTDLSEGGLRCVLVADLPAEVVLSAGQPATVVLDDPALARLSGPLEGRVMRRRRGTHAVPGTVSVRFDDLTIADGDVLRRHVFSRLRERRQAGLG